MNPAQKARKALREYYDTTPQEEQDRFREEWMREVDEAIERQEADSKGTKGPA